MGPDFDQLALPFEVADETLDAIRHGVDLEPRADPRVSDMVYRALRDVGAPPGMLDDVAAWTERLRNDPEARLRKQLADRAGIPYSQALLRWREPDDLAAELASIGLRAEDHKARCQTCGTRPDEWLDFTDPEWPRPLDHPPYKFFLWDCYACDMLYELNQGVDQEQTARGMRWIIAPRADGEPTVDGF